MTTSPSPDTASPFNSSGGSFASWPRWRRWLSELCNTARHLGATLNWHRDPDYETRMLALRKDRERIENEIAQIEKETEQLRRENARLKALNALTRERFFAPGSWPTPATTPEPDSGTSSS